MMKSTSRKNWYMIDIQQDWLALSTLVRLTIKFPQWKWLLLHPPLKWPLAFLPWWWEGSFPVFTSHWPTFPQLESQASHCWTSCGRQQSIWSKVTSLFPSRQAMAAARTAGTIACMETLESPPRRSMHTVWTRRHSSSFLMLHTWWRLPGTAYHIQDIIVTTCSGQVHFNNMHRTWNVFPVRSWM